MNPQPETQVASPSSPQVLYEVRLSRAGGKLFYGGAMLLGLWIAAGIVVCFVIVPFPDRLFLMVIFGLGAVGIWVHSARMRQLKCNPGWYRISIDDHGVYIHSDDTGSPSLTVLAPNLARLVRLTIRNSEGSDERAYYIETKSGARHQIEPLFAEHEFDVMQLFGKITDRFHWVEVEEEEVQQ